MEEGMKENGWTTICMARDFILGEMAVLTTDSI